ncbi:hypothetical protein HMPREF1143_2212 [Peptoanaerobacter stomatis]|uniref:DUF4044 domain-containing protein n=1 Tax=Peptoanaerobacter stomatis TaxID=796937 RepID=J4WDW8_9FIRM|nr:DUF4044 domain-containing protein [Peptoanaerobacter stomatis]EJU23586.1 hypothetical protein HMPREF1143_2212 [Peptoanaerobacter stomatis]NWO24318.1 DUF4044 domain-containing protein [Peptostreptococcaceae bacterium oral taxon 081]
MNSNKKVKKKNIESSKVRKNDISDIAKRRKTKQKTLAIVAILALLAMVGSTVLGALMSMF